MTQEECDQYFAKTGIRFEPETPLRFSVSRYPNFAVGLGWRVYQEGGVASGMKEPLLVAATEHEWLAHKIKELLEEAKWDYYAHQHDGVTLTIPNEQLENK